MNKLSLNRWISGIFLIIILTIIDRLTKLWAASTLNGDFDIAIISGVLEMHYLENTGAAFSILSGRVALLGAVTVLMCIFIVYVMLRLPTGDRYKPLWYCLIFLLAGALGNFYDRIVYHYVVDFISFVLINFPIFNMADIYVTVSMFVLIFLILFYYSDDDLNMIFKSTGKKDA